MRVIAKADSRLLVRHFHLAAATAARVAAFLERTRCGNGQLGAASVVQAAPDLSLFESHLPDRSPPSPCDSESGAGCAVRKLKVVLNSKQPAGPRDRRKFPGCLRVVRKGKGSSSKSRKNAGRRRAGRKARDLGGGRERIAWKAWQLRPCGCNPNQSMARAAKKGPTTYARECVVLQFRAIP